MIREIDPGHLAIHRAAGHAQRLAHHLSQTGAYMIAGCHLADRTKSDALRELSDLCEAMGFAIVKYASAANSNDLATEPNGDIAGRG